jgi:hypothetical protein
MLSILGCVEPPRQTSDDIQRQQQEKILQEGSSQVGMPAIKNFREKKLLKEIFELRDQMSLPTYTYLWAETSGKKVFFCNSIGYGIPYATQFTNPQKVEWETRPGYHYEMTTLPQADPNGLFSPSSADGTWVLCKDPKGTEVKPVFIEPRIIVSPFELTESEVANK